jgi:hypothetical protein
MTTRDATQDIARLGVILQQIDYLSVTTREDGSKYLTLDGYAEITQADSDLIDNVLERGWERITSIPGCASMSKRDLIANIDNAF